MSDEVHIAGLIVHVGRARLDAVKASLALLPSATLHTATDDGRMIVTLEAESAKRILDYMDAIKALPGVLNVALVYQHAEDSAAMDEVIE